MWSMCGVEALEASQMASARHVGCLQCCDAAHLVGARDMPPLGGPICGDSVAGSTSSPGGAARRLTSARVLSGHEACPTGCARPIPPTPAPRRRGRMAHQSALRDAKHATRGDSQ